MSGKVSTFIVMLAVGAAPAAMAQSAAPQGQDQVRSAPRRQDQSRQQRYQIGVMERVLEDAVEHGASIWRDRLQSVLPSQTMLLDNARARGYRLDGYGVFFDVEVPSMEFETTLFSVFRTLDQNGLGLQNALNQVKAHVVAAGDPNLEQALKRIELQLGPVAPPPALSQFPGTRASGTAALSPSAAPPGTPGASSFAAPPVAADAPDANDPILNDPGEAYRAEVKVALIDAMLDHSNGLGVDSSEWLTVGASRNEVRPRVALGDGNVRKTIIRVRGSDLAAFRAGQLSREQAIERVEVRVF